VARTLAISGADAILTKLPAKASVSSMQASAFRQQLELEASEAEADETENHEPAAAPLAVSPKTKTKNGKKEEQGSAKQKSNAADNVAIVNIPLAPKPPVNPQLALSTQLSAFFAAPVDEEPADKTPLPVGHGSETKSRAASQAKPESSAATTSAVIPETTSAVIAVTTPKSLGGPVETKPEPSAGTTSHAAPETKPETSPETKSAAAGDAKAHPDAGEIAFEGLITRQQQQPVSKAPVATPEAPVQERPTTTAVKTSDDAGAHAGGNPLATAAYETEVPAKPQSPAPVFSVPAPAEAPRLEAEPEHQAAPAVQQVRVQVEAPGGQRAEVRVTEASGELHLSVRADASLSQALRDNLPELRTQLERNDVQADLWHPGAVRVSEAASTGGGDTGSSEAGNEHGAAGQQYQPEWLEQLAQARIKQKQTRRGQ
jgi:hypothetical protein